MKVFWILATFWCSTGWCYYDMDSVVIKEGKKGQELLCYKDRGQSVCLKLAQVDDPSIKYGPEDKPRFTRLKLTKFVLEPRGKTQVFGAVIEWKAQAGSLMISGPGGQILAEGTVDASGNARIDHASDAHFAEALGRGLVFGAEEPGGTSDPKVINLATEIWLEHFLVPAIEDYVHRHSIIKP